MGNATARWMALGLVAGPALFTEYEVDLSGKHASALRQSLDQFIGVGDGAGDSSSETVRQ